MAPYVCHARSRNFKQFSVNNFVIRVRCATAKATNKLLIRVSENLKLQYLKMIQIHLTKNIAINKIFTNKRS